MTPNAHLKLSENSIKVLERRYLKKDDRGHITESPQELFWRVAKAIAESDRIYGASDKEVEQTAQAFYDMMARLEFMPNSPTLMNAGRPLGQLSACFVLPVEDSMESIFETLKHTALIHKTGGGTGFSFSRLRPQNDIVSTTSGVASGPVSFMKVFNAATEAVKQGGTRRGANMGILRVDHPDILEFISCKDDLSQVTNFNISVAVTDDFMRAVEEGRPYTLRNPRTGGPYYEGNIPKTLDAQKVFESIVDHAWQSGEPGVVFIDRMNQTNPTFGLEEIEATNPCGEQPLPAYDSCNLGSINLGACVKHHLPKNFDPHKSADEGVDWEKLGHLVKLGVHFLDNVIDANRYPIEEIARQTKANRRIGLGVMGWADMLVQLGIPYNSQEALDLGEKMIKFINTEGHNYSSDLATRRGKFPNWEHSIYGKENVAMRNCTVTTIAPTGTISIIAGCSSGIEPYYAISYIRNVMDNTRLLEVNPYFEKIARERAFYSEDLMERIAKENTLQDFNEIPEDIRRIFVTAADVTPEMHIRMQAVFQKHNDSATSKTINFPREATRDDVRTAYRLAYSLDCKGVTVYRDGSRPAQVLSTGKTAEQFKAAQTIRERPESLTGFTEKIKTGYGNLYVTVNVFDGKPFEVFAQIGKSGYSTMADTEAICRLISLALRSFVPVDLVIEQLRGIGGGSPVFQNGNLVTSIPDAIAKVLERHFSSRASGKLVDILTIEACPDCGSKLEQTEGCVLCHACGFSKC